MNVELLKEVRDFIVRHPRNVDMNRWVYETVSCGTVGCIAGVTCILSGVDVTPSEAKCTAQTLLGLSYYEADSLFIPGSWPTDLYAKLNRSTGQEYANVVAERIDRFIENDRLRRTA